MTIRSLSPALVPAILLAGCVSVPAPLAATPAAETAKPPETPGDAVTAAPASDWREIAANDLLVMTLAPDSAGKPRQVVIQLMPAPFSQGWVGNIRKLAAAHWWDGTTVYRVVDNWVTQWGDGEDDPAKAKPLPGGMRTVPESEYAVALPASRFVPLAAATAKGRGEAVAKASDAYADTAGYYEGWPVASDGSTAWPTHCYGAVGVARDLSPDTGSGAELYTVIGEAPRQLDRNIAVVGRVIEGIDNLSALPRGHGDHGVYEGDEVKLKVPIVSVRLASELPEGERPRFEYLSTESDSFSRYVAISANRSDSFYKVPAGGIALCNLKVPLRRVKQ